MTSALHAVIQSGTSPSLESMPPVPPCECKCKAHISELWWVWDLIDIEEPMTESGCCKLAQALIPQILKRSDLKEFRFEECRLGTQYAVDHVLQLPSGTSLHLTGWPDFAVTERLTQEARFRGKAMKMHRLYAVGETQSRLGLDPTTTMAQAGIYGVGQLSRVPHKRMTVITFFKDKSAHVAMASNLTPDQPVEGSMGEVSYKFVKNVCTLSLKKKMNCKNLRE